MGHNTRVDEENEIKKAQSCDTNTNSKILSNRTSALDLSEVELTWITNHLGHNKDVHKGWYRKEDATIELTKVAKVLVAIDTGESRSILNKRIDSLQTRCKC